ncbi:MAG: TniB family NTP-binding protein [Dermatophilaceae bacterium]
MTNRWARWLADNPPQPFVLSRKAGWDAFVNAASRTPLERLSRQQMAELSGDEREDYDEARMVWHANLPTIRTQQLTQAYGVIDQVMASGRRDGDRLRGSVVIDAAPNLGKTTIATRYAKDFQRRMYRRAGPHTAEGHQRLPVAFVPLAAGCTLKGLNQQLLSFYGHPAADRATTTRLAALAVDCVIACETRLIIIDDVHFIDFRHKHGLEVSNHLKSLANEMPVTFVYVGVQLKEKKFFDEGQLGEQAAYAQTSRRATRVEVVPFRIDTDPGMRAWVHLLRAIEPQLLLADSRPGMLTDHAKELHRRTQGNIGSLTSLVERACALAISCGVEAVTKDVIEQTTIDNAAESLSRAG